MANIIQRHHKQLAMQVVLLDEPTTGLDPDSRNYLWHAIKLAKRDRAIILTSKFVHLDLV